MKGVIWVVLSTLLALLAISPDSTAQPSSKIAFASTRDGNAQIYVINPDGTGLTRLTNHPRKNESRVWRDRSPAFSPDRGKIAFESWGREVRFVPPLRIEVIRIYLMNADGTRVIGIGPDEASAPAFSPDGRRIAFLLGFDVFIMNVDGSNVIRLTRDRLVAGLTPPSFSPDGRKIAFTCTGVCVMNADGTELSKLTLPPTIAAQTSYSAFSPDGMKIAFAASSSQGGASDIYILSLDSGDVTRLTENPAADSAPTFSPDGLNIAFVSNRDGNNEIYIMNIDGSQVKRLTNHLASDSDPSWR